MYGLWIVSLCNASLLNPVCRYVRSVTSTKLYKSKALTSPVSSNFGKRCAASLDELAAIVKTRGRGAPRWTSAMDVQLIELWTAVAEQV